MKRITLMIALSFWSIVALADCPALDYQEMKEMKVEDLTKEYCKAKATTTRYTAESRLESKYSSDLRDVNSISRSLARDNSITEALEKAVKLQESADRCKSQETRMERVLVLNGVAEAGLNALCSK